ncbi:hypothetical protein CBR_g54102 [Chara braunii]|uniref:Prohibitin n=1 Tax=Chara braunii TaxID=69332 RepID=A0A388MBR3_CHABU|nr:hypothetical protein CBR_g54102 [Chara braunii]|eukprot:GBG92007.1 hypothetical protein CBR_g54102 [Chara braunii]
MAAAQSPKAAQLLGRLARLAAALGVAGSMAQASLYTDLQMVNLTLRVLSKPDMQMLPHIFQHLGIDYDERVLPSIGNEVLKAVVAQFNADQLLTERPYVSKLVRDALTKRAKDFNILLDDVAIVPQQEAERSKFVVMKAEQERRAAIIKAEGESEAARLVMWWMRAIVFRGAQPCFFLVLFCHGV